jgi:hypothetical protein
MRSLSTSNHGGNRTQLEASRPDERFCGMRLCALAEMLATNPRLAGKIAELENRLETHDSVIQDLIEAIKELMTPKDPPRRRIGFELPAAKAGGIVLVTLQAEPF